MKEKREHLEEPTRSFDHAKRDQDSLEFEVEDANPDAASTLGRFQLLRHLAEGGLGKVSIARDVELNREVALKQIKLKYSDDARAQLRFVREAEVTGSLEHPGIVPVYGLGADTNNHPFYAMRLIRGESLSSAIQRLHRDAQANRTDRTGRQSQTVAPKQATRASRDSKRLDRVELQKLLRRFIDVCNTMDYAHHHGVVHRDLKPANIMLGPYGETLVVDWGLAKRIGQSEPRELTSDSSPSSEMPTVDLDLDVIQAENVATVDAQFDIEAETEPASSRAAAEDFSFDPSVESLAREAAEATGNSSKDVTLTVDGTVIGTLSFMSPEQAAGEVKTLTAATDIYSLGAILYTILAGCSPLANVAKQDALARVLTGKYPTPRQRFSQVPRPLEAICRRAMQINPAERYESAKDLADEIESWMADQPVRAHREPLSERVTRLARRHRSWSVAIFATSCLLAIGSSIALVLINNARNRADYQSRMATSLRLAREAETLRTTSPIRSSLLALEAMRVTTEEDGVLPQARAAVYNSLANVSSQRIAKLASFPRAMIKRSDGLWLTMDGSYNVECWDFAKLDTSAQPLWSVAKEEYDEASLQATGNFVAFGKPDGTVELWDLRNSPPTKESQQAANEFVDFLSFDPGGKWLVTTAGTKAVLWDLRKGDGKLNRRGELELTMPPARTWFMRWPNQRMLGIGNRSGIDLFTTATAGMERLEATPFEQPLQVVGSDPNLKWLATSPQREWVRLWDLSAEVPEPRDYPLPADFMADSITFSADGRWVLLGSRSGACIVIETNNSESTVQLLQPHADRISALAFNLAGDRCATASRDGLIRLWELSDLARPRLLHELRGHDGMVSAIVFDGTDLISGGFDGVIRRWSPSGELVGDEHRRSYYGSNPWGLQFLNSGQLLISGSEAFVELKEIAHRYTEPTTSRAVRSKLFEIGDYRAAVASADGRWLYATDSVNYRTYDLQSLNPEPIATWKGAQYEYAIGMDVSRDGQYLVSAAAETLLWKLQAGKPIGPAQKIGEEAFQARFSPDGRWLAISPKESLDLYRFVDDKATHVLTMPGDTDLVEAVDFSPDSKELAWAGRDGVIHVYDLSPATGPIEARQYLGHFQGVTSLRYSPDGKWIASSGTRDMTVRLWDRAIDDSRPADTPLRVGTTMAIQVEFSRDSNWLVASYEDGYLRAWSLDLPTVAKKLREQIGRDLTSDERREFLLPPQTAKAQ